MAAADLGLLLGLLLGSLCCCCWAFAAAAFFRKKKNKNKAPISDGDLGREKSLAAHNFLQTRAGLATGGSTKTAAVAIGTGASGTPRGAMVPHSGVVDMSGTSRKSRFARGSRASNNAFLGEDSESRGGSSRPSLLSTLAI
jgi:hypothetical protein